MDTVTTQSPTKVNRASASKSSTAVGPRYLLCPPDYFDAHFLFNPWMNHREHVDIRKARSQWRQLVRVMEEAGAQLDFMEPTGGSGALVYTADVALVIDHDRVLVLRNDGPRGMLEPPLVGSWFRENGYVTESLPPSYTLDGGNILTLADGSYLVGLKPGATGKSEAYLARLLHLVRGAKVEPLGLIDSRYLHLDMVVGRLGDRGYLVFEQGLYQGAAAIAESPLAGSEILGVTPDEARNFACNAITINETVITGPISKQLERRIRRLGLWVEQLPLTEFYKAGGGAKCLTMPLTLEWTDKE